MNFHSLYYISIKDSRKASSRINIKWKCNLICFALHRLNLRRLKLMRTESNVVVLCSVVLSWVELG